jgi:7-alpha-hydroxysteroid dehydrogenase
MTLERFRLDGKVALVTGASRGLGAAIARTYAEAGASVAVVARTEIDLEAVAADVIAAGGRALALPADVSELAVLPDLVERTAGELGRLDIVVNNAGGTLPGPFLDTSAASFEGALHFNVATAFELTRVAVPYLLRNEGASVVNITSAMGRLRDRGYVAYGTAKAALVHMTRLLAADLAPRIRVNAIAPGSIMTSALEVVLTKPELMTEMIAKTPLRRIGDPDDVAACALYLASPAASFVTGKVIDVDGGIETPNLDMRLPDLTPGAP